MSTETVAKKLFSIDEFQVIVQNAVSDRKSPRCRACGRMWPAKAGAGVIRFV